MSFDPVITDKALIQCWSFDRLSSAS